MLTALPVTTLASEFTRTITAPDPDGSTVPQYSTAWATTLRIGAICDTPNATLSVTVYLLNSIQQPLNVAPLQFTSGPAPDWAGFYTARPNLTPMWPIGGAKIIAVKVDSMVSAATWTLLGAMA